jgi:hypothetical protein
MFVLCLRSRAADHCSGFTRGLRVTERDAGWVDVVVVGPGVGFGYGDGGGLWGGAPGDRPRTPEVVDHGRWRPPDPHAGGLVATKDR